MMEIWRVVEGYEKAYEVSNLGRVRSIDRIDSANRKLKGKILKQSYTRGQYLSVGLYKCGKMKNYRVNRLVAVAFIDKIKGFTQAGHMDDNKENNKATNIYWTDSKENNTHNDKHLRIAKKISKSIIGTSKDGCIIRFKSSLEANRLGFNGSAIRNCLIGLSKSSGGYVWRYS